MDPAGLVRFATLWGVLSLALVIYTGAKIYSGLPRNTEGYYLNWRIAATGLWWGFTLLGPRQVPLPHSRVPVSFTQAPPSYPWHDDYLLVRPDQHIAWRGTSPAPADIDAALSAATGSSAWT